MDLFSGLIHGFSVALTPMNLLFGFLGAVIGTIVGILPGLGPLGTMALLLSLTYGFDPTAGMILFAGIYFGAMYGGSTTSILLNIPGEAASVITVIEGYQMARRGRAGAALAVAAIGSFVAGTISLIGLSFLAPTLAMAALKFGPRRVSGRRPGRARDHVAADGRESPQIADDDRPRARPRNARRARLTRRHRCASAGGQQPAAGGPGEREPGRAGQHRPDDHRRPGQGRVPEPDRPAEAARCRRARPTPSAPVRPKPTARPSAGSRADGTARRGHRAAARPAPARRPGPRSRSARRTSSR